MKQTLFLLFLGLLCLTSCKSQQPVNPENLNISQLWEKVEESESNGLPKTALDYVNRILSHPSLKDHPNDRIKATLYKARLVVIGEEDEPENIIYTLEEDYRNFQFPEKNILAHYLGGLYFNYLQLRGHVLWDANETSQFDTTDLREWPAQALLDKAADYSEQSLENANGLKQLSIENFKELLQDPKSEYRFHPSLFHLLAAHYIASQRRYEQLLQNKSGDPLLDRTAFGGTEVFRKWYVPESLPQSTRRQLLLMQELEATEKDDLRAWYQNERLNSVRHMYKGVEGDSLYKKSLEEIYFSSSESYAKALAATSLAEFHFAQFASSGYKTDDGMKTQNWWDQVNTEDAEIRSRKKKGLASLNQGELLLKMEACYTIGENLKAWVEYRNLDILEYSLYKIDDEVLMEDISRYIHHHRGKLPGKLTEVLSENQKLVPGDGKIYKKSAEVRISPPKKSGKYLLKISGPKNKRMQFALFQVSDLYIFQQHNNQSGKRDFYAVDRWTGKPISGVKLSIFTISSYRDDFRKLHQVKDLLSDENGSYSHEQLQFDVHPQKLVRFEYGEDVYEFVHYFGRHTRSVDVPRNHGVFFTDKALYLPGQHISFAYLALQKTSDGVPRIRSNEFVEVQLFGANHRQIGSQTLKTNEFGVLHGRFEIPEGELKGSYRLRADNSQFVVKVEEYKRPKFELEFIKQDQAFRLGDTVSQKVSVKALAGFALDDVNIKYEVRRRNWRYPYYIYRHYGIPWRSESSLVATGSGKTDANGEFQIEFQSLTDPEEQVLGHGYTYEVEVTASDLTGETQQKTHGLTIGKHSAYFRLGGMNSVMRDTSNLSMNLRSHDANGVPSNLKAQVTLYRLKVPDRKMRKRLWAAPDVHLYDSTQFVEWFPLDPYGDELNPATWERVELNEVKYQWHGSLDTAMDFDHGPGQYLVNFDLEDDEGHKVNHEFYFTIVREGQEVESAGLMPIWLQEWKNHEPGEKTHFPVWFPKPLHLLTAWSSQKLLEGPKWTNSGDYRVFSRVVTEKDRGGIHLYFAGVAYNRLLNNSVQFSVPWSNKLLDVHTENVRKTYLPGEEAEWNFKFKFPDENKSDLHLTATMYDAALDAIYRLNWSFGHLFPRSRNIFFISHFGQWANVFWVHRDRDYHPINKYIPPSLDHFKLGHFYSYGIPYAESDGIVVRGNNVRIDSETYEEQLDATTSREIL